MDGNGPERRRSADVVYDEVRIERHAQLQHFDSLDSKAGVILGFAAAVIALAPSGVSTTVDAGRFVAILGAAFAFAAYWPRTIPAIKLRNLRDRRPDSSKPRSPRLGWRA